MNRLSEQMTEFQYQKFLQMILVILKKSKTLDEAIGEVEQLLEEK